MKRLRASKHAREWMQVGVIARVWGVVGVVVALIAIGVGLGAWLIPAAFFWVLLGGG